VPVIEHFPAKFYLLSDQSFLWPDMWPDQFRLVKSPISKNCLFNTFLLMKPTRKQYRQHFSTILHFSTKF
jgi:hypothetical protein